MSDARTRPVRVLELACGSGMTRIAVGRRLLTREIHYTGIDRNRSRLEAIEALTRAAAKALLPTDPASEITISVPLGDAYALNGRVKARFVKAELNLNDPDALARELGALLGKERFDEVHVHLLHPGKHGCQPTGPRVLRVLAKHLRPGARLYHLFQHSSPFFDFQPERPGPSREGLCPAAGAPGDAIGRNETRFGKVAAQAGLALEKCGHRWERIRGNANWVTRRFAGAEPDRHSAEAYHRVAEQYSGYSRYASHFVILRKRVRRPAAPRRARARRLTGV